MMRFVLCGLMCSLALGAPSSAQVLADYVRELHLEDFLAEARVSRPRLSPDGTRIAYYDQGDHETQGNRLTVRDLDAPRGSGYVRADFGEFRILGVSWANDERLLVTLGVPGRVRIYRTDFNVEYTRVLSFSSRTLDDPVILFEGEGRRVERNLFNIQLHEVADILPGQPDHVLMPAHRSQALHLWRVNILTGEADIVERGNNRTARWYTGPDGRAVMRVDVSARGRRVSVFTRNEAGRWRRSATYRTNELSDAAPEFDWAGASDDPGQIYVFASPDETGLTGVYLYDLESGTYLETVGSHDRVDVTGTMIHPRTGRYMGYSYIDDRLHIEFADAAIARHYRGIDDFFGGEVSVMPRDYSPSGRMIVEVSGPREPGVYYLYDEQAASIEPLYSSRPRLAPDALADVDIIRYTARDGLELTGYLTLPEGGARRTTPLVVMPHGGPEMRDVYDFDIFAQYLALNGYAVFQPNFRGSAGYGEAFAQAGYRQWGAAMQDDITDGVSHLISRGRADPDRICIMGFSYGGYAALMGGATTPDLYQCVIAGSSVTDLSGFVDYWRSEDNEEALDYWTEAIGDPRTEAERLRAHSPVNLAASFIVPVLLFHGDDDAIVPVEQSRDMARALEAAGVVHHYEEFRGGRHTLSLEGAEVRSILVRSLEFLDRMIGDQRGSGEVFAGEGVAFDSTRDVADSDNRKRPN